MNKHLKEKIKQWLSDWDKTYPKNLMIDDDTFEGGAYNLLMEVLANDKKLEKEVVEFFNEIVNGIVLTEIKDKDKQDLIFRNLKIDIRTLKSILNQ